MFQSPTAERDVISSLDLIGREILQKNDYRLVAIVSLLIVLLFALVRRLRFRAWPSVTDCLRVALSLITLWSALLVGVVFLLTRPPAIESLSSTELSIMGLVTVVAVFGLVVPDLKLLIFPPQEDAAPQQNSNGSLS